MKNITLLSLTLLLTLGTTSAFAKIWRVNNNTGVNANFTTLQAAHDGASANDTLHVEGSTTNYGGLNATKALVIIGPGYYLSQNPNTQANLVLASANSITFNAGSEGSVVMGMTVNDLYIRVSNILITRNHTNHVYFSNTSTIMSNIIISKNVVGRITIHYGFENVSNALILNNWIFNSGIYLQAGSSALIQNNVLENGTITVYNSLVSNNIMVSGNFSGTNNTLSNNLSNSTQFTPTAENPGSENKTNVDMSSVFVGAGTGVSTDGKWQLKVGSPAIGAGLGGVDAGMFGGDAPYVLSGLPPVPSIYSLNVPATGSTSSPLKVTISTKSNK